VTALDQAGGEQGQRRDAEQLAGRVSPPALGLAGGASVLASESGVAASTASSHLGKLLDSGLLVVEQHGRHRYFRIAGPAVSDLLEALARLAPPMPISSLRQGTNAQALRFARTCYDHLAGVLGTGLMAAMLDRGLLTGGDGVFDAGTPNGDRLAAPGLDFDYRVTARGIEELRAFGIDFEALPQRRALVRYCVDWSEQRHHLAGSLGAALAERMFALGWIDRTRSGRAVRISDEGRSGLHERFGLELSVG
jgi:DNA-binding transcriptional ArsR family regulator